MKHGDCLEIGLSQVLHYGGIETGAVEKGIIVTNHIFPLDGINTWYIMQHVFSSPRNYTTGIQRCMMILDYNGCIIMITSG